MRKRLFPLAIIAFGAFLVMASLAYWQVMKATDTPESAALPDTLAGLSLTAESYGPEAVSEITRLHDQKFPLSSGAYGMYGSQGGMAMLWVAGAPAKLMAARMVDEMEQAIANGDSPFKPIETREGNGRILYELTGMGQRHYYFQSNNLVIWLAVDDPIAETALDGALNFYP